MVTISKFTLLFNTIRYLKPIQIRYRLKYFIRNRFGKNPSLQTGTSISEPKVEKLKFSKAIHNCNSYKSSNSFTFLNLEHSFTDKIDWNYPEYGRLWTYNLNYFEFINQGTITVNEGLKLIDEFIETISNNKVGLESYPISLRIMNWIRFFITHNINDSKYQNSLWLQLQLLCKQKEYHLLGNHLLENGFALLFGSYYFNDISLYKQARNILINELDEQILEDGAHFELSPMYHCLMTYRVLDCFNLVSNNNLFDQELLQLLKGRAEKMLAFMNNFTFRNGDIPLFNDAANSIAPTPNQLQSYAKELNLAPTKHLKLSDSGYRKLASENIELFFDIGEVGPTYQPGHAHADTLSFELYINGRPVIVDTGTSTYELNETRFYERSTAAHNTVTINNENSSQVWAGHRVGKRAKTNVVEDTDFCVTASHDGYFKRFGVIHKRGIRIDETEVFIEDDILNGEGVAHFHFHPNEEIEISENEVRGKDFVVVFKNPLSLTLNTSHYSPEFNKRIESMSIEVSFRGNLTTNIKLK